MQTVQVRISIPKRLFVCLREMLCQRRMSLQEYFEDLAASDTKMIRKQKCRADCLLPSGPKAEKIQTTDNDLHRTKLRPTQIQRLIFLAEQNLPVRDIGQRLGIAVSSVRRILAQRAANRTQIPRASSARTNRGASERQADG